ncbi:HTTM domain-containing protein [Streptomyces sp. AJS327]|uniref:HTTM domain-containing protein n=1 Tax=Streptomyces sp. AJS327 TaxID=2545265 RepID=UPI0027E53DB0|nr:HTTM domain-containing protein [Streptomyces sp. AJS327]
MAHGLERVTGAALGPYQSAVVRIGFAATWLLFLLREWPHRHELYGPDSPWGWDLAERLVDSNGAFTILLWSDSESWFEFVYLFAMAASLALLLGWRTRAASVLFMVGVLGLQNRSVFMGDGGDNVIHLIAMYLVLTRCGQVWSLDARRARARETSSPPGDATGVVLWSVLGAILFGATSVGGFSTGWALFLWGLWLIHGLWWTVNRLAPEGEPRRVCDILANLAHNGALLVIMAEVCLIYATAGWYKIQGSRWQDGTAAYYPLHLDYFSPWPWLGDLVASSGTAIMVMTYATVITQVAFPFTLFNRRVKNVLLAVMIAEHLSIAVLMGLPFFSMAMIAADAVFLPTALLVWLGARASGLGARVRGRLPARRRPATDPSADPFEADDPGDGPGPHPADRSGEHRDPAYAAPPVHASASPTGPDPALPAQRTVATGASPADGSAGAGAPADGARRTDGEQPSGRDEPDGGNRLSWGRPDSPDG